MKDYTEKLLKLLADGKRESSKFEKISEEVFEKREQKKEKYVAQSHQMLSRLAEAASTRGVKLGIENREALEEIPIDISPRGPSEIGTNAEPAIGRLGTPANRVGYTHFDTSTDIGIVPIAATRCRFGLVWV